MRLYLTKSELRVTLRNFRSIKIHHMLITILVTIDSLDLAELFVEQLFSEKKNRI